MTQSPFLITGTSTSYAAPYAYAPLNAFLPPTERVYDFQTWVNRVTQAMATNIANGTGAGYPGGWDFSKYGTWDHEVGTGQVSAGTLTAIASWLMNDYQPGMSKWIDTNFPMVQRGATVRIETPEATAFRIANEQWEKSFALDQRQQAFKEYQFAVELALKNSSTRISSGGSSSGSTGRSSSSSSRSAVDAYQWAKLALDAEIARGRLKLDTLQAQADIAYKGALAANLAWQQDFSEKQFEYQKQQDAFQNMMQIEQLRQRRADTIAQLSANPADAIQREYRLRTGQEPLGLPQNIFTGRTGSDLVTLSDLMRSQAPLVQNVPLLFGQSSLPPTSLAPQMAHGGGTKAEMFITGDPQVPGVPNPELVSIDYENREAHVVPLSRALQMLTARRGR